MQQNDLKSNISELKTYLNKKPLESNFNYCYNSTKEDTLMQDNETKIETQQYKINSFLNEISTCFNENFAIYQNKIKDNVDKVIMLSNVRRNFLLTSIDKDILDLKISEIIILLENELKKVKVKERNCFSFDTMNVKTHKMLFQLNKIFQSMKDNNKELELIKKLQGKENENHFCTNNGANYKNKNANLNGTPFFKGSNNKYTNLINKAGSSKNLLKKNIFKNPVDIYRSPSPVINRKNKRKFGDNINNTNSNIKSNRTNSKETYRTPEKKLLWQY